MRLFLDTSVLLAASGSSKGASRFLLQEASAHGWELLSSDYCEEETRRNLPKLGREVYGLRIATPGEFLLEQRAKGLI